MTSDEYVEARLAHGSLCWACPLNGQRKVGKDGPVSASVYGIAEAPGEDEERWGARRGAKYGTPLVGKSGYRMRIENLVPAGLAQKYDQFGKRILTREKEYNIGGSREGRYVKLKLGDVFLTNVIMCRPPGNNIDSKEGKAAVRCCANSLKWFLRTQLEKDPNKTLVTVGATSTSVLRGRKTKIDAHRGRVQHYADVAAWSSITLKPESESAILKVVLRGRKPKEEWWPQFEKILTLILRAQRTGIAKASRRCPTEIEPVLTVVKLLVQRQRAALKKRASSASAPTPV